MCTRTQKQPTLSGRHLARSFRYPRGKARETLVVHTAKATGPLAFIANVICRFVNVQPRQFKTYCLPHITCLSSEQACSAREPRSKGVSGSKKNPEGAMRLSRA